MQHSPPGRYDALFEPPAARRAEITAVTLRDHGVRAAIRASATPPRRWKAIVHYCAGDP